jgi:hypothetical protein
MIKKDFQNSISNLASYFFLLVIIFNCYIFIYSLRAILGSTNVNSGFYFFCICLALCLSFVSYKILRSKNIELKINLFLLSFSTIFVVFSFEIFLELKRTNVKSIIQIAAEENIKFDARSKLDVLNSYNEEKIIILPNIPPYYFLETNGLSIFKDRIFPLGGISNQKVILDNELGYYPIIETDEYGFNNIKGLYNKNTDVLLIGDSFAEGYSVNSNQTISALLNEEGLNTLSLGKGGNGPLIEFATLREFISHLKPKSVFWLYCVNDMFNLERELKSTLLKNYLFDDNYS